MRIIFLDIDGVLTSARAHCALCPRHLQGLIWHNFDPVAIGFLNRLVDQFKDLRFVLSSTWRKIYDQRTMTMMLNQTGWNGEWHQNWKTPEIGTRGQDIDAWVREHKPTKFAILDDDPNPKEFLTLTDYLVQTDERDGMNSLLHFNKLQEILK